MGDTAHRPARRRSSANAARSEVDPFLGAGLGYQIVNATCEVNGIDYCGGAYSSEIYFITKGGIRYFLSDKTTLYADVGVGAATLNVGLMWKIKSGS
mgnify:CR=1 FL=1